MITKALCEKGKMKGVFVNEKSQTSGHKKPQKHNLE